MTTEKLTSKELAMSLIIGSVFSVERSFPPLAGQAGIMGLRYLFIYCRARRRSTSSLSASF